MKDIFREYHKYTKEEFEKLWKNCLFVFDTNTLLNMYRYSRGTVERYFKVLARLKKNKQLWIPYQVGYEFYENRINVISEYEKSYDQILLILNSAKNDIETKYRDHPFLDLEEINKGIKKGLLATENKIKRAKKDHPSWLKKDEVLEEINKLFKDSIGKNYSKTKLEEIKKEAAERYEKKIPPGFKDKNKEEVKRYGDLILWYQIIDKAKQSKKPIVFISGDIKEDWWLENDGKRLMPLPQLKKEMYDKASVDFHIYTADIFLELSKTKKDEIDKETIREVRNVRELNERRMVINRNRLMEKEGELDPGIFEHYYMEYSHLFGRIEGLFMVINDSGVHLKHQKELDRIFFKLRNSRNKIMHGDLDRKLFYGVYRDIKELVYFVDKMIHSGDIDVKLSLEVRESVSKLEYLIRRLMRHL